MLRASSSAVGVRFLASIKAGPGLKPSARDAGIDKEVGYRRLREKYLHLRRAGETPALLGFTTSRLLAWEADVDRSDDRRHLRVDFDEEAAFWASFKDGQGTKEAVRAAGVCRSTGYRWIYKRFDRLQRAGVTLRRCQTQLRLTDDRTRILEERRLLRLRAGDHIVSSANLCGGSITQLEVTLRRFGVETTSVRKFRAGRLRRCNHRHEARNVQASLFRSCQNRSMLSALPVLDMSDLDGTPEEARAFRDRLREVTHEVGFFYLTGHGVDQDLIDEILHVSRRFFDLPSAQKLAIENVHSPQFRGYTRVGGELTHGDVDWREQIDIGAERETVPPGPGVADYWRLEGPNLWPAALPEFRVAAEKWREALSTVALRLLRTWAAALGVPADVFDPAFASRPYSLIKIVRYPGESDAQPKQGVGAHRDGGVLTLLLVEPGKGGLQVEHDGEWIDAPTLPGAFVVNIGEMLELATDGYLKATLHRVQSPQIGADRISIPFFFNPALDSPMPHLELGSELNDGARGLSVDPTNSPILETYGENVLRYRLRAHPNVAAIHHLDLIEGTAR